MVSFFFYLLSLFLWDLFTYTNLGKMQLDITDAAVLFQKGEGQPHSYAEKIGKKGANQTS